MQNTYKQEPSNKEVKNPSPEEDRGPAIEKESFFGGRTIPYGYFEIVRIKEFSCLYNPIREVVVVRNPLVATCDTQDVSNRRAIAIARRARLQEFKKIIKQQKKNKIIKEQKNDEIIKEQKNDKIIKEQKNLVVEEHEEPVSGSEYFGIVPQGAVGIPNYDKLIRDSKLVERLSRHNLGGGLGKKKRSDRYISQGKETRTQSNTLPSISSSSLRERSDQKSSLCARSILKRKQIDDKLEKISMQVGWGLPGIGVDTNTSELIEELTRAISEKKVDITADVKEALASLTDAIRSASNPNVTHTLNISNMFPSFTNGVPKVVYAAGALLFVLFLARHNTTALKGILALAGLSALFMVDWSSQMRDCFNTILDWARGEAEGCSDTEEPITSQSISSHVVDSIIGFMYYGHAMATKREPTSVQALSSFFNRTKDMRKIRDGVEFTFSYILSYIQKFLDWMSEVFNFKKYDITMDGRPEISIYADKVALTLKSFTEGKILNCESAKEIISLYAEGNKIAKALPSSPEYVDARRLIQQTVSELSPIMLKIRRSNLHNNGPRIQPVGIFLTGPPGVGKTTALTPMMLEVTARTIPKDQVPAFKANHNDFIYNRISENVYYDAYNGQYNTLHDDLGQTTDVDGVTNNPYMEFIRMVNSNSMDLHMAHLDDKGTTGFRSKFVWATSNVNKFRLKSIVNSGALTRRFTLSYMVVPAPGYREDENETDPWKMQLKKGVEFMPGSPHLDFYDYDALNGKVVSTVAIKMGEVIERIICAHNYTQTFGQNLLDLHESFKLSALSKRDDDNEEESVRAQAGGEVSNTPGFAPDEDFTTYIARIRVVGKRPRERVISVETTSSPILVGICSAYDSIVKAIFSYRNKIVSTYQSFSSTPESRAILSGLNFLVCYLFGLYGIRAIVDLFSSPPTETQSGDYEHQRMINRKPRVSSKKPHKPSLIVNKGGRIRTQLAYDATCDDIMYKIFKKNCYTMHQSIDAEKMGTVTMIGGHDAFMPRHFAEIVLAKRRDGLLPENFTIYLRPASNPTIFYEIAWDDIDVFFDEDWDGEDICFCRFPNVLPQAPNIRKYIAEDSDILTKKFSGKMLRVDSRGTLHVPFTDMVPISDLPYDGYINPIGYSYSIPTKEGDCGNLLFVSNPLSGVQKVIGYHVAGQEKRGHGYGTRICQSYIRSYDEFMKGFDRLVVDEVASFDPDFTTESVEPQSFKTLFKSRKSNPPLSTSIVPSPLYNTYAPPLCVPANLRVFKSDSGEDVDPWLISRAKYARSSPYMDLDVLTQCTFSYGSKIVNVSSDDAPWKKKVFSFEEAVKGVPGVPNCEGIPRSTSSGYPFCLDIPSGHKGKSHFFGRGDEYEFISSECEELKKRVEHIIRSAKLGHRLQHIYFDFLKDERRLIEKVKSGSTRLVSASPVDLLIATRMYFMDFVRWYMNNRIVNGSAVGMNPFSSEWDALRRFLRGRKDLKNLIAGDFKAYDACLTRQIQMCFLQFVNQWYNDGNDLIRAVLFEDVCNSKHIYGETVYEWQGGNPSGCFLTTILNTFCNNVILRYASILAHDEFVHGPGYHVVSTPSQVAKLLTALEKQVFFQAYGDDNIIAVSEGLSPWLNQCTLTTALDKIGFTYTLENKGDGVVPPLRSINEVSFLKRSWVYDRTVDTHIAALSMDTILEMCQWTKRNDRDFNNVKDTVDTCLKELSANGDTHWNKWAKSIMKESDEKLGYLSPISSRRQALALQLSRDGVDE